MTAPIDIECPACKSAPGSYCTSATTEPRVRQRVTFHHAERVDAAMRDASVKGAPPVAERPHPVYYGLLRVHADGDGRLTPLWYTVGDAARFEQMTVVDGEYTIAICTLSARTMEEARAHLKEELHWFKPLLGSATPEPWFASEDPAR